MEWSGEHSGVVTSPLRARGEEKLFLHCIFGMQGSVSDNRLSLFGAGDGQLLGSSVCDGMPWQRRTEMCSNVCSVLGCDARDPSTEYRRRAYLLRQVA